MGDPGHACKEKRDPVRLLCCAVLCHAEKDRRVEESGQSLRPIVHVDVFHDGVYHESAHHGKIHITAGLDFSQWWLVGLNLMLQLLQIRHNSMFGIFGLC